MTNEVGVTLQAKNQAAIKLLLAMYDNHLLLNDIAVRLNEKINKESKKMILNPKDGEHLGSAFGKITQIFTEIRQQYGSVTNFAANFAGPTQDWAQKLIVELVDFNNGFAVLNSRKEKITAAKEQKMNAWLDGLMDEIAASNEAFAKLTKKG